MLRYSGIDTVIKGSASEQPSSYGVLFFYPCSLPDQSQCAKIDDFKNNYIQVQYLEPEINYGNKEKPVGYLMEPDNFLPINPNHYTEIGQVLIQYEIIDYYGFLFPSKSVLNYTRH